MKTTARQLCDVRAEEIRAMGSAATYQRAQAYVDKVVILSQRPHKVSARVKGSASTSYAVSVSLDERGLIDSVCSCPVGFACKHAVATLLCLTRGTQGPVAVRDEIRQWLDRFTRLRGGPLPDGRKRSHALAYVLDVHQEQGACLFLFKVRLNKDGPAGEGEPWANLERAVSNPPAFVDAVDLACLRTLRSVAGPAVPLFRHRSMCEGWRLDFQGAVALVGELLAAGRLRLGAVTGPVLALGAPRTGVPVWDSDRRGLRVFRLQVGDERLSVLNLEGPWYLDAQAGCLGPVDSGLPPAELAELMKLPPLNVLEASLLAEAFAKLAPALPQPVAPGGRQLIDAPLQPTLVLRSLPVRGVFDREHRFRGSGEFDFAEVSLRYGDRVCQPDDTETFQVDARGQIVQIRRDRKAEQQALKALMQQGFRPVPREAVVLRQGDLPPNAFGLASEAQWPAFMAGGLEALAAAGWQVTLAQTFRHRVTEVETVCLDVEEAANGWLAVSPGLEVEGLRVELAPLLADLFARDRRWLAGEIATIDDDEAVLLWHPELGRLRLRAVRLKPLVAALVDLFDSPGGVLQVSRLDAPRLHALGLSEDATLAALAGKLRGMAGVAPVDTPAGFLATLRPYQREGLAWLQHLVRNDLAGILADDMGLGKTAQALAHLVRLKEDGGLRQPALIVLPTSLVFNWEKEAGRFAPGLRIVRLHGVDRHERFECLDACDVALTTYPLLWRDADVLKARHWSLLVLDEAQTVKNVKSQAAQVIRQLKASHRLGLTGTPLENHLGELWAQFDFLLPGFLGDAKTFNRLWRVPIERQGDTDRRDLLARRIRPFILRRKKEDVAAELPPKTVIVRSVALEGGQRDLYEAVRAAMDDKVRGEIAARGFARSQMVILEALLKLRQVCCDPRLVKTASARKVKERAKLDLLMDMLPELIDEGRRILVFSQFTEMLALIATELDRRRVAYVTLTGQTLDRRTPVEDFQAGRAPVFLISLKAGGVGLNLTAADTVIHFDPWWNPAAENQATDRAHRIGQTKPVFVFKLVVDGSIEERILALQEKKAALAAGVLSEDVDGLAKFGEADLAALLAPLPPARG